MAIFIPGFNTKDLSSFHTFLMIFEEQLEMGNYGCLQLWAPKKPRRQVTE
jgi:hypothetical protein